MDEQIFKNHYALERMIVWFINPLELNARWFDPSELGKKMLPGKHFQSLTPKKLTLQIYSQEKYTLRYHNQNQITIKEPPGFLRFGIPQ